MIDLYHPKAATVTRSDVTSLLASKFKVADDKTIFVFGFKTQFGGGKTTGFACIYDSLENALEIEPTYRLRRNNPDLSKKATTRKATRESKNKRKKVRIRSRRAALPASLLAHACPSLRSLRTLS